MLLGKKRKFEKLKVQFELLEEDMCRDNIMELSRNHNLYNNNNTYHSISLVQEYTQGIQTKKKHFLIYAQQLKIFTEMYTIMPEDVDEEELKSLIITFFSNIESFIGSEEEFNQDRTFISKVFLGKQYKHYQENGLERNVKIKDLDNIIDFVFTLAKMAEEEGYLEYGQEFLNNMKKELKEKQLMTDEILNNIEIHRQSLSNLEREELIKKKEEISKRKEEVKRELKEEIKSMIKNKQ